MVGKGAGGGMWLKKRDKYYDLRMAGCLRVGTKN